MAEDQIVRVGLVSNSGLKILRDGLTRQSPVTCDGIFDDLLEQLDAIKIEPLRRGVPLQPRRGQS